MKKNILFALAFLFISLASAIPIITPILTPTGSTQNSSINIKYNLSCDTGLSCTTNFTFGGSSFVFDPILFYNFDNRSELGENATNVADLSGWGNNGTISNLTWETGYGRNDYGGFIFNSNTSAGVSKHIYRTQVLTNKSENFTISIWVKPYNYSYNDDTYILRAIGVYGLLFRFSGDTSVKSCYLEFWNGSSGSNTFGSKTINEYIVSSNNNCFIGSWHNLIAKVNNANNISFYVDGKLYFRGQSNYGYNTYPFAGVLTTMRIGSAGTDYPTLEYAYFNGSIDDLIIFNRTLSDAEITLLYRTSLTKYDIQNSTMLITPDLTASVLIPSANYSYYLCASNSSSDTICSTENSIIKFLKRTILTKSINIFGKINSYFYGTNTHVRDLSYGSLIDVGGVSANTLANTTWHREMWNKAKFNNQRGDMYLTNYFRAYSTGINPSFERWGNTTEWNLNASSPSNEPDGLSFSTYNAGGKYGFIFNRSTDAHSGNYSLRVLDNSTEGGAGNSAFVYWTITIPQESHAYNFTFWMKTSNIITAKAGWNDGAITISSKSINTSEIWQYNSINWTSDGTYTSLRIDVNAQVNETFLIDDIQLWKDGVPTTYSQIKTLENQTELVTWVHDNDGKILYITDRVSSSIVGDECRYKNETYFINYCLGKINYSEIYIPMVKDFINQVTINGTHIDDILIEVMNEPYYYDGWLSNISDDNINGAYEYVNAYNPIYNSLKNLYPSLSIGGASGFRSAPNLSKTFISNLSGKFDFISIHPYYSSYLTSDGLLTDVNEQLGYCATYGVSCPYLILSEWNANGYHINTTTFNSTKQYNQTLKADITRAYMSLLNNYPANITSQIYEWADLWKLNYTNYPDGGYVYSMISEPKQDNFVQTQYNATYDLSRYASSGSNVLITTINDSADGQITSSNNQVVCTDSGGLSCVGVNIDDEAVNWSWGVLPSGTYIEVDTRDILTSDGVNEVQAGVKDAYAVPIITKAYTSKQGGTWYWTNYLYEPLRTMTPDEKYALGIEVGCSQTTNVGFSIILILSAVAIMVFIMTYIIKDGGLAEMTIGKVVMLSIGVIVTIIFWQVAAQNLGGQCPVS